MVFETLSFHNKLLEIIRPNNFASDTIGIQTSTIAIGSKMPDVDLFATWVNVYLAQFVSVKPYPEVLF